MGGTSHHFAVFYWLKASPGSHPHSRGGNNRRVMEVMVGGVSPLDAPTVHTSLQWWTHCLYCHAFHILLVLFMYVCLFGKEFLLPCSLFVHFSYNIVSRPFLLSVVCTYSSLSVILLRPWHLELTTLPVETSTSIMGLLLSFIWVL